MDQLSPSLRRALGAIAARLRGARLLRVGGVVVASSCVIGMVMVSLGAILSPTPVASWPRYGGWFAIAFLAVYFLRDVWRPVPLETAAAEADRVAGLKDELKSSLWFARSGVATPWVAAHVTHAEQLAGGIDPRRIVPFAMPASGWAAIGLLAMLAGVTWLSPRFTPHFERHVSPAQVAHEPEAVVKPEVAKLMDEAAQIGDAEARAKLEKALAAIDDPRRSAGERQRALEDARRLVAQRALDASAATEQLRSLADALDGRQDMKDVAQALRAGDAKQAAAALRKRLEGADRKKDGDGVGARSPNPQTSDKALVDALKKSLQAEAKQQRDAGGGETSGRIAKAVQNLEEIAKRLDTAAALNQVGRRVAALSTSFNRETNMRAARFGEQQGTAQGQQASDTGNANIQGGTMFRLGAVARERRQPGQESSRAGDASGSARGDPVVGDEVSRIDVKYKRETVRDQDGGAGAGRDSAFYAATREADAQVDFVPVEHRFRYVGEEAMSPERIALRNRTQVKEFFSENAGRAQ